MLVGTIIVIGLIGGYFQIQLFSNMEGNGVRNVFFSAWVVDPSSLNEKGMYYRKAIFICWVLVILLIFIILALHRID
jgi:uncharacterized BrkB/YihY/UPF0761 family membrane protein